MVKLLKENIKGKFFDLGVNGDFWILSQKHRQQKKNKDRGLHPTKKASAKKRNQQGEETTYRMEENFANNM